MHQMWAELHDAGAGVSEASARGVPGLNARREADAALERALAADSPRPARLTLAARPEVPGLGPG